MIVIDSNIISYLFIQGKETDKVKRVLRKDSDWIAPILWRSEFRSVLSLYIRNRYMTLRQAKYLIEAAEKLMLESEYQVNSGKVLELVNTSKCSSYDCEYVALAQDTGMPLVTADKKILKEFPSTARSITHFLD